MFKFPRAAACLWVVVAQASHAPTSHAAEVSVVDGRYQGEKYVSISGVIEKGDLELTVDAARTALLTGSNTLAFLLNSPGGDVAEAMKIGRLIRDLMATTYVYGTMLYTPGAGDVSGLEAMGESFSQVRFHLVPIPDGVLPDDEDIGRCYSACVLIFYGGVDRFVSDNSDARRGLSSQSPYPVMGLHRPFFAQDQFALLSPTEARTAYAQLEREVRGYLREMGASEEVAARMFNSASNELDLVPQSEFENLYVRQEPFIDEWLIAKCDAFGPGAALERAEQLEYDAYSSALSDAIAAGEITSSEEFDNFVPHDTTLERIQTIQARIFEHNRRSMTCRESAIGLHQLEWLRGGAER
jgi:hypothetical protein